MTTETSREAPSEFLFERSRTRTKVRRWLLFLVLAVVAYFVSINMVGRSLQRMFNSADETQQSPATAESDSEWFEEVAGVSPSKFSEIRCFEDVSIDATFHCRFRFSGLEDVHRIVDLNHLRRIKTVRFLNQFGIAGAEYPDWYDLRSIPDDSPKYGSDSADDRRPMWLYINQEAKVAYLEMLY